MTNHLIAQTNIALTDAGPVLARLCAHIQDHGADYHRTAGRHELRFPFGTAILVPDQDHVRVEVAGPSLAAIFDLRGIIAEHLQEFTPQPLDIRWTGDGAAMKRPPNFRLLDVTAIRDLTPRMRRIRFAGNDLVGFAGLDNIHVRLVFAPEGRALILPEIGSDGLERWPGGADQPQFRRYTIRHIDADAGWLDIDFVLHTEAAGPGSRFAETARSGDRIGMMGPGGGSLPLDRDWYLIAGDETALPAIARFLDLLPDSACGHVVIGIADKAERQPLTYRPGITVEWVTYDDLAAATRRHRPDAPRPFVWAGCEDTAFRALRSWVRDDLALPKGAHSIVSYWRKGMASH